MTTTNARRIKRGWMNLRVNAIHDETHDTKTFVLVDADEGGRQFDYEAGQYLTFRFDHIEAKPLVRSYTLSSSPNQGDFIALTVKRVEKGLVSNWMCDHIKVGDIMRARGPIGKFCYQPTKHRDHLIMIAAGSGVTPFVSMLREHAPRLGQPGSPKKMTLLVAYRSQQDLICWADLLKVKDIPGITIKTTLTREDASQDFLHGRPDTHMLDAVIADAYTDATFMTCGPEEMMGMVVEHCRVRGAPEEQVELESFY